MRSDAAGLRTWLLAALGGWMLVVWAATLFGLGSRIGSADGALEAPPLPAVPTPTPPRAAASDNTEAQARPLFASDRRPHPFVLGGGDEQPAGTVRLTGVLITPGMEMATLTTDQGQSLRLRLGGEAQGGWQLLSVEPRSAVVSGPSGTLTLEMQVYSGSGKAEGGAAPPLPATPATGAASTNGATAGTTTASGAAGAAAPPPAPAAAPAAPKSDEAGPSAEQIKAIRERIQARRRQAQQQQAGAPGGQKP